MGLEKPLATPRSKECVPAAAPVERRGSAPDVSPVVPKRSPVLLQLDDDEEEEYVTFIRFESLPMLFPYHADSLVDSEDDMGDDQYWPTC